MNGDKINNMKQQRPYLTKPVKSLSARAFSKSARKPPTSRRNDTLPVEPIQPFLQTKRVVELEGKSSRVMGIPFQGKKSSFFFRPQEQLQEENRTLKLKIHQLKDVLGKERTRYCHDRKNYTKIEEKLDIEFSDERYFDMSARNNNLVDGVKYQYYKMKQKYEDKCTELEKLMKRSDTTASEEYRIYLEALQSDNSKLKNRMIALVNLEEKLFYQLKNQQGKETEEERRQRQLFQILGLSSEFTLLQKKLVDAELRVDKYQEKISVLKAKIKQQRKKIEFLDKLLLEKSNEAHHSVLKERRIAKQCQLQTETVEKLKKQVKELEEQHEASYQMLKEKQNTRFETEKTIFTKCLREKDAEIQKLKQEIYYLSTIISYIKTGDDPFKVELVPTNLSKKNSYKEQSSQFLQNLQKTLISIEGDNLTTRKRVKTLIESGFKQANSPRAQGNTQNLKIIQIISDSENEGESVKGSLLRNSQLEDVGAVQTRVAKKSHLKHSEGAVKVRAVKPSQIDSLKKELVYRFMFYKLEMNQVREFFSLADDSSLSKKEKRWRSQYATLKEIKEKLQSYPFDLRHEQALLLSRYIVEDCTKDNVYYHEDNEVERTITISILRAFVGEYIVPDEQMAKAELKVILGKSGKNLQSALTSLAPTGFISSLKFCEICESIQIDFSEETKSYILSQLLAKSLEGLAKLQYGLIFTNLLSS